MKWEDLKVYKPIPNQEIKPAFAKFTKAIAQNLSHFGFTQHGRMLITQSNDLLQIIHIDSRGSWTGTKDTFNTEICLIAVTDTLPILRGFSLTGRKRIQDIILGIQDYYRISQEYELLANFLSRNIVEHILPYFDRYNSSLEIIKDHNFFGVAGIPVNDLSLVLHSKLQNKIATDTKEILDELSSYVTGVEPYRNKAKMTGYFTELELYKEALLHENWEVIDNQLSENKSKVLKALKL